MFEDTWFDDLQSEGYITDVIRPLKSGKEASVHLCRGAPSTGEALLAAKVYRPRAARSFKNDAAYTAGRVITNARTRRAVQGKTRFGREVEEWMWVGREYETLREVHTAGAEVPRPVACSDTAILMEYVGDEDEAAPQLKDVRLSEREAAHVFERLLQNVEVFLSRNLVHADLSRSTCCGGTGRSGSSTSPRRWTPGPTPTPGTCCGATSSTCVVSPPVSESTAIRRSWHRGCGTVSCWPGCDALHPQHVPRAGCTLQSCAVDRPPIPET